MTAVSKMTGATSVFSTSALPGRKSIDVDNTFFGHLRFHQRDDEWNTYVRDKLTEFCALDKGWDGYNGLPTKFDVAEFSYSLLQRLYGVSTPFPSIVPLANGGVQIEWHTGKLDIELTIERPNSVDVWAQDNSGSVEVQLTNDFTDLIPWIQKLG